MIKVLSVFGTRPDAIKMAPVVQELGRHPEKIESRVLVTGQHRRMLDQVLEIFGVSPHYDLDVMKEDQSSSQVAAAVMAGVEPILQEESPDWVLVQGDTTTAAATALTSFYSGVKVGHIEAGLRTFSKHHPFPEEVNRRIATVVADLHFAPTQRAREHLLYEGVPADRILVTGNPVIDALHQIAEVPISPNGWHPRVPRNKRLVLVTAHRKENLGAPLENICHALLTIAKKFPEVHIVYSVHLNPHVHDPVHALLSGVSNLTLAPPLDYLTLVQLMKRCEIVLTDSGGLQEEAPSLGKPVLVLREVTERPEAVEAGTVRVIGTESKRIVDEASMLLTNEEEYQRIARAVNPYGDGNAASRIVGALLTSWWDQPRQDHTLDQIGRKSPGLTTRNGRGQESAS